MKLLGVFMAILVGVISWFSIVEAWPVSNPEISSHVSQI